MCVFLSAKLGLDRGVLGSPSAGLVKEKAVSEVWGWVLGLPSACVLCLLLGDLLGLYSSCVLLIDGQL